MDEMKIGSKFMSAVVGRFINRTIKKKFGYDVKAHLNGFHAAVMEDAAHVHLDIDLECSKSELDKILKQIGL